MQNMKINKKGYMFILDVAIAITIIIIASVILFYNYRSSNKIIYYTDQLSEDVIGVLSHTQIKDLCLKPGSPADEGCDCPNYKNLTQIICNKLLKDFDANLLSMMSELIETSSVDGRILKDLIRDIFVNKKVIDEKRFGFAVLYTDLKSAVPLELYNTETYT